MRNEYLLSFYLKPIRMQLYYLLAYARARKQSEFLIEDNHKKYEALENIQADYQLAQDQLQAEKLKTETLQVTLEKAKSERTWSKVWNDFLTNTKVSTSVHSYEKGEVKDNLETSPEKKKKNRFEYKFPNYSYGMGDQ